MIPEPYELFDIDKGADKVFLIGSAWIVLFCSSFEIGSNRTFEHSE